MFAWVGNAGNLISRGVHFRLDDKPDFGFAYDVLYYEPPTALFRYSQGGRHYELNEKQKAAINDFCESFADSADYEVYGYDDSGNFAGSMLKSEAEAKGLAYGLTPPDHQASKWTGQKWERIAAVIMEDGSLKLMPGEICELCLLTFTAAEWEAFPQPDKEKPYLKWDFKSESWVDKRDFASWREHIIKMIKFRLNVLRSDRTGTHSADFEPHTWEYQLDEAETWLADNRASTPGLDAYLEECGVLLSKAELCESIVAKHKAFYIHNMRINAAVKKWKLKLEACAELADLDSVFADFQAWAVSYAKS